MRSELSADKDIISTMGAAWNDVHDQWDDEQATEFFEKCFVPLVDKVEDIGKDARDLLRIADDAHEKIDAIMEDL